MIRSLVFGLAIIGVGWASFLSLNAQDASDEPKFAAGGLSSSAEVPVLKVYYVDNKIGSDDFDGLSKKPVGEKSGPFKTIMHACKVCAVGARIEIVNTGQDYREAVSIEGLKKGRADAPLIIDGNGAYVSGLVEVPKEAWVHYRDDIYYFPNKVGGADYKPKGWYERKIGDGFYGIMPNSNWLGFLKHQGWFDEKEAPEIFILNGKPGPSVRKLEDIVPGGFFYDSQASTIKDLPKQRCLFFRLPKDKTLDSCVVELPLHRGVYISDDYVTVCDLGSRYSQDDGFSGFWGQGVVLRNIHAVYNCDQGVSFHGNSSTLIDGALIERNGGCGIVDVMSCSTIYRNVVVKDNYPAGVLFQGAFHAMYSCRVEGNHGQQVASEKGASASLINCLIIGNKAKLKNGGTALRMEFGRIDRCTIVDAKVGALLNAGVKVSSSVITNCDIAVSVRTSSDQKCSISNTVIGGGVVTVDRKPLADGEWPAPPKGLLAKESVLVKDNLSLQGPSYQLDKQSPYAKAGENGRMPGAQLKGK